MITKSRPSSPAPRASAPSKSHARVGDIAAGTSRAAVVVQGLHSGALNDAKRQDADPEGEVGAITGRAEGATGRKARCRDRSRSQLNTPGWVGGLEAIHRSGRPRRAPRPGRPCRGSGRSGGAGERPKSPRSRRPPARPSGAITPGLGRERGERAAPRQRAQDRAKKKQVFRRRAGPGRSGPRPEPSSLILQSGRSRAEGQELLGAPAQAGQNRVRRAIEAGRGVAHAHFPLVFSKPSLGQSVRPRR